MSGIRRRSLADQAGRLVALGLLVAVLALAAVGMPRATDALLTTNLHAQVTGASASARDLIADVDAGKYVGQAPDAAYSITPTWKAMPTTLREARLAMPQRLRDTTGTGRYVGVGMPTEGVLGGIAGFPVPSSPGAPRGQEFLTVEAYPELHEDATLVTGRWPMPPTSAAVPIPVVVSASAAATLHWKLGQVKAIPNKDDPTRSLVLVGTVKPRDTDSDYWQLSSTRAKTLAEPNSDGEMQYGSVVWVDASDWTALGPRLLGTQIVAWYPIFGKQASLSTLGVLQDDLTGFLANPVEINDGTGDGKQLRLASQLPAILQGFQGTQQTSSSILALALAATLGVGALVLLATVSLLMRARRRVRELMRTRGATAGRLACAAAGELAVAAVPGAVIGAAVSVLLVAEPSGMPVIGVREAVTTLVCAIAPVVAGAAFVSVGEGMPAAGRALVARNVWVGELLLVLLAVAGIVVVAGEAAQGAGANGGSGPTGATDPFVVATPLLIGLAASVVVLRGYPLLLRGVGHMLRGAGHPSSFVGLREAARGAGTAWLVSAALTATVSGVLTVELVSSAARAQSAAKTPGAPLLAPGTVPLVGVAVVLCVLVAASAFAVSAVSDAARRRRCVTTLYALGFRRGAAARVSLWGAVPAAVVSVVAGAVAGVLCAAPVLGAVAAGISASSGSAGSGAQLTATVTVDWPLVGAVAVAVLVLALVIDVVAVAADARGLAPEGRRKA